MVQYVPFLESKYHIWVDNHLVVGNIESFEKAKKLLLTKYPKCFAQIRDDLNAVIFEQKLRDSN